MAMGGFALNYFSYRTRSSALACASVAPASSISTCTGAAMSGMYFADIYELGCPAVRSVRVFHLGLYRLNTDELACSCATLQAAF